MPLETETPGINPTRKSLPPTDVLFFCLLAVKEEMIPGMILELEGSPGITGYRILVELESLDSIGTSISTHRSLSHFVPFQIEPQPPGNRRKRIRRL
jgi:hypothetical protein